VHLPVAWALAHTEAKLQPLHLQIKTAKLHDLYQSGTPKK
jgi:hypothetical protein